jgi:hypothetical protein
MNNSIKVGLALVFLEFFWILFWFSVMVVFNTHTGVPPNMEESHFAAVIRVVGLAAVIAGIYELTKKEGPDSMSLLFWLFALFVVVLVDIHGILESFIHFAEIRKGKDEYYWNLFFTTAIIALILTVAEFIWLFIITVPHFGDAFKRIRELLNTKEEKSDYEMMPQTRKIVGLKNL